MDCVNFSYYFDSNKYLLAYVERNETLHEACTVDLVISDPAPSGSGALSRKSRYIFGPGAHFSKVPITFRVGKRFYAQCLTLKIKILLVLKAKQ